MKGLGVFTGAMFLAGNMAGSGVLALPKAVSDTGKPQTLLHIFVTDV